MTKTSKVDDSAMIEYERKIDEKVDYFKSHEKYEWLREYTNQALMHRTTFGYYAIKAKDFLERIIKMDLDYIRDWLDGKNNLEWQQ